MRSQIHHQTRAYVQEGGLVVGWHTKINVETGCIDIQSLGSNRVCNEPKTITCRDTPDTRAPWSGNTHISHNFTSTHPTSTPNSTGDHKIHSHFFDHGDLIIHRLWEKQTACILDTRVINTDQPVYCSTSPSQLLTYQIRVKKKKYQELCFELRRHFTTYVVCANGLLGMEAKTFNKCMAPFRT